ncbi:MAG: TonB-dependent receptor plug domain-containing protein, partial [Oxalicibacterium faecigallinarum]|uniref:TonB-dependent siderophore receptor n=1 Tax=Oxalicibacterium faecigallinarum TaxID=573741 RepID=UPI0028074128
MAQSLSSSSSAALALSFRRTAIACAALQLLVGIAMLTPVMMPTTAHAQTAETKRAYDIPAGQLTSVLQRFGRQAEVMLSFSAELTDGLTSQGIAGQYTVQGGLNAVLEGTGVQALRQQNGGYVLQKMAAPVSRADETTLPSVTVRAERDPVTEGTGSYAVRAASTATKLNLSLRETPQSVTVVTRKQMEDMGAQSLTDIMSEVTGIVVQSLDTERTNYTSRGYQISTYQIDGVNTAYSNGYVKLVSDPAVYDRIEVLRGAAGHTVGAGDPGGTINQVRKR